MPGCHLLVRPQKRVASILFDKHAVLVNKRAWEPESYGRELRTLPFIMLKNGARPPAVSPLPASCNSLTGVMKQKIRHQAGSRDVSPESPIPHSVKSHTVILA